MTDAEKNDLAIRQNHIKTTTETNETNYNDDEDHAQRNNVRAPQAHDLQAA